MVQNVQKKKKKCIFYLSLFQYLQCHLHSNIPVKCYPKAIQIKHSYNSNIFFSQQFRVKLQIAISTTFYSSLYDTLLNFPPHNYLKKQKTTHHQFYNHKTKARREEIIYYISQHIFI